MPELGDDGGFDADDAAGRLDKTDRIIVERGARAYLDKVGPHIGPEQAFIAGAAWASCFRWE